MARTPEHRLSSRLPLAAALAALLAAALLAAAALPWNDRAFADGAQGDPGQARQGAASYTVSFDANPPAGCSTTPSGSMDSHTVAYGESISLANSFSLPGYKFTGWNTRPDGTGTTYSESAGENLTTEDGGKVTLYAQWEAHKYTVNLEGHTAGGWSTSSQKFTFDQPGTLSSIEELGFSGREGEKLFLGWRSAVGNKLYLYPDQAHVINLCGFVEGDDMPLGYTLTAQWIAGDAKAYVIVMDNHEDGSMTPITGLAGKLSLSKDGASFNCFTKIAGQQGVYAVEGSGLSAGTYDVKLEGYDTADKTITIEEGETAMVALDYCTVKTASEGHLKTEISLDGKTWASELENVLVGTKLELRTTADAGSGYAFSNYTATGIDPEFENGRTDQAQQTITVLGSTTITAQWKVEDEGELDPNPGEPDQKPAPKPEAPAAQPDSPSNSNGDPQSADVAANEAIASTGDSIPVVAAILAAVVVAGAAVLVIAAKKRSRGSGR